MTEETVKTDKLSKADKEALIQKCYDLSFKYDAERGCCSQCVLSALMETLDIGDPAIVQAADGMAGGTALTTNGTCGALTGGLMALGTVVGRPYEDFCKGERKRRVFIFTKKLYDKFEKEYGSTICKEIHQNIFGRTFDLTDKDDYVVFDGMGAHTDKCTGISGNVAKWTAEIILNDIKKV